MLNEQKLVLSKYLSEGGLQAYKREKGGGGELIHNISHLLLVLTIFANKIKQLDLKNVRTLTICI